MRDDFVFDDFVSRPDFCAFDEFKRIIGGDAGCGAFSLVSSYNHSDLGSVAIKMYLLNDCVSTKKSLKL